MDPTLAQILTYMVNLEAEVKRLRVLLAEVEATQKRSPPVPGAGGP